MSSDKLIRHAADCYWLRAYWPLDGDEAACCSCGALEDAYAVTAALNQGNTVDAERAIGELEQAWATCAELENELDRLREALGDLLAVRFSSNAHEIHAAYERATNALNQKEL